MRESQTQTARKTERNRERQSEIEMGGKSVVHAALLLY